MADVAAIYDINPLYADDVRGAGHTLGIATYANFNIADVQTYWHIAGLATKPDRLTKARIEGGAPLSAEAGTDETSLDVEQSGGLAPAADIVVYDAPNSDAAGTGYGVSVLCWPIPAYQFALAGTAWSQPGQTLTDRTTSPATDQLALPAYYPGCNLPDISMNADPYSGYIVYLEPDGGLISGYGGTSFVAPQLNGIAALLGQAGDTRRGPLNSQLYGYQRAGYHRGGPPRDITRGDNWFWPAVTGYDLATGVGTPDVDG